MFTKFLTRSLVLGSISLLVSCNYSVNLDEAKETPASEESQAAESNEGSKDEKPAAEQTVQSFESEETSFELTETPEDCIAKIDSKPKLKALIEEKEINIEDLCEKLIEIAETYEQNETLTLLTMAGTTNIEGQYSYFVGAAGYNLTAIREFSSSIKNRGYVKACFKDALEIAKNPEQTISQSGFKMKACVEDKSGLTYPEPIFSYKESDVQMEELGETGAALSMVVYNMPGGKSAVGVIGGSYVTDQESYLSVGGCGFAISVDKPSKTIVGAGSVCALADYE